MRRIALLCGLASILQAGASNGIADQSQPSRHAPKGWYGLEIGPTFSVPIPGGSANRDVIGLDAGLSCTAKTDPYVGFGVTIAYHYWPVSAQFKQQFNALLSERTLNILKLGDGTWGFQVLQLGGHVRVAAPSTRGMRPWLQVEASAYEVDPNTTGYSGNAGFFTVSAPPLKRTQQLGLSVAAGLDLVGGTGARMGLDATYHRLDTRQLYGRDLQVFTLGAHALFGW